MRREKFRHGDVVQIADDLGQHMKHFTAGVRGIVIGSYRDQYGGNNTKDYTIFVEGQGEKAWYEEHQLTFIEHNPALLDTWEEHVEARHRDLESLPWIIEHWEEVKKSPSATSILALFHAVGHSSSFERNGEYFCLYSDWEQALPWLDVLVTSKTIEDIRAIQKPGAPPELVQEFEQMWNQLHQIKIP